METLIVIAVIAAIGIPVAIVARRDKQKQAEQFAQALAGAQELRRFEDEEPRLLAAGTPATAEITDVRETGASLNLKPEMVISLAVDGPSGAPYHATVKRLVSPAEMASYPVGARVDVRIDPQQPAKLAIVPGTARSQEGPIALNELSCERCAATLNQADFAEQNSLRFVNCPYCGASYQVTSG